MPPEVVGTLDAEFGADKIGYPDLVAGGNRIAIFGAGMSNKHKHHKGHPHPHPAAPQQPLVQPQPPATPEPAVSQSGGSCFLRLIWMIVGNIVLVLTARAIWVNRDSAFSWLDPFFWALVAALAAIRYWDMKKFGGQTATGKPVSPDLYRKYLYILIGVAAVLWVAAHLLRNRA